MDTKLLATDETQMKHGYREEREKGHRCFLAADETQMERR
jgi:hypothetical protein